MEEAIKELMIFMWFIGWFFTFGFTIVEFKPESFVEMVSIMVFLAMLNLALWPFLLGVVIQEKFQRILKTIEKK